VVTFLNIVVKVSPNPRTGSRKPAMGQASLSVVVDAPGVVGVSGSCGTGRP
jgi:hypothetical protein